MMTQNRETYLDNAATTRVADKVADVVRACLVEDFGNPSSAHRAGIAAERRVKAARAELQRALGDETQRGRLVFTSGGTEADALAVIGAARARVRRGKELLCSAVEHPAVIESMALLTREGWQKAEIPVAPTGAIDPNEVAARIGPATAVVAVMLVNNELGTIAPIADIARAVRRANPETHVHCDAVQALGKLPIDVYELGVDSLAVSAHKLHGPKGVGALWLRDGARVAPIWAGGGQEQGIRSGTENVSGIAGFGEAARIALAGMAEHRRRWAELGSSLVEALRGAGAEVRINCEATARAPHILSLVFAGVPAEPLLHALEAQGVLVSSGSACASLHKGPSHVLRAIGAKERDGVLRVSFGRDTNQRDIDRAGEAFVHALHQLA